MSDQWKQIEALWEASPAACTALGLLVLGALIVAYRKMRAAQRTTRVVVLTAIVGIVVVLFVFVIVDPLQRWGWALALLPAIMVGHHAAFLRLVRMPFRAQADGAKPTGLEPPEQKEAGGAMPWAELRPVYAAAQRNSDRYFSPSTLAIRYGVPAIAIALVGIIVFYLLFVEHKNNPDPTINAAKLGVAGAYVYLLLYLGQRNFRQDVTSGGAMWCAVLLAVGPVLAWSIAHFSHGVLVAGATPEKDKLSDELIYFAAGLAPRHVAAFIGEMIRRVWVSPGDAQTALPRTIPITQIKGITTGIAERLSEEGVLDVHGLAYADPLRLIRNTNFDKRQIIAWIDEAILISVLPDHWQALEKAGFTGAIDVAWIKSRTSSTDKAAITDLARWVKFDDAAILAGVIDRLAGDAQLRMVWVLYQVIDQLEAETGLETHKTKTAHEPA